MLNLIRIQNFITIDHCELELKHGLITITGDTGSGKSLLIQAIHFALGAKLSLQDAHLKSPSVSLVFDIENHPKVQAAIQKETIDLNEMNCIITRKLSANKKNSFRINNTPCTRAFVQSIAELLLQAHGQHATFALLKNNHQRTVLDQMLDPNLITATRECYQTWKQCQKEYTKLQEEQVHYENQMALLQYQLEEFASVNYARTHTQTIEQKLKRINQASDIIENCQQSCYELKGDHSHAIIPAVDRIKHQLDKQLAEIDEAKEASQLLEQGVTLMMEAHDQLEQISNNIEHNPEKMKLLDDELGLLHQLARKHQVTIDELESTQKHLEDSLQAMQSVQTRLNNLAEQLQAHQENYHKQARMLSKARSQAAPRLEQEVIKNMEALNFLQAKMQINIQSDPSIRSENGHDHVEFLIACNPGHDPAPMNKVASGGELSRISLALQLSLMSEHDQASLLFDEIDVGISGKTAAMVGEKLYQLGQTRQVMCITHLAQVAAQGHQHLQVQKTTNRQTTITQIQSLSHTQRIDEIARIIGGIELDASSKQHAKQLLDHCE